MNFKNLIFSIEEDFYLIKINRPKKLNALNQDTLLELKKCILVYFYTAQNSKFQFRSHHNFGMLE